MVQRNDVAAFPFAGSGKGQLAFGKNDALVLTAEAAFGWAQAQALVPQPIAAISFTRFRFSLSLDPAAKEA